MILGIGTDLVQRDRVKAIYEKYDKRFLDKVLSDFEKKEFIKLKENAKVNFLCSSFAAKEAFVKALGTGFRGIYPSDISIEKDDLGKPKIPSCVTAAEILNLFPNLFLKTFLAIAPAATREAVSLAEDLPPPL